MSLSALELSQMRLDQGDYQPDTCTLQTVTRVADSVGGWSETWANTYENVVCRVSPLSSGEGEDNNGNQLASITDWVLTVAYDQALDVQMRCIHNSGTYEIERVEDTHSHRTARRAFMRRVD